MPFGPENIPNIYTVMMQTLRKEYIVLFAEIRYSISITTSSTTMICDKKLALMIY